MFAFAEMYFNMRFGQMAFVEEPHCEPRNTLQSDHIMLHNRNLHSIKPYSFPQMDYIK